MSPEEIKEVIQSALPEAQVFVNGEDGVHFDAEIINPTFAGKSKLERQKMVYQILNPLITEGKIHAFSMQTYTEEEWAAKL